MQSRSLQAAAPPNRTQPVNPSTVLCVINTCSLPHFPPTECNLNAITAPTPLVHSGLQSACSIISLSCCIQTCVLVITSQIYFDIGYKYLDVMLMHMHAHAIQSTARLYDIHVFSPVFEIESIRLLEWADPWFTVIAYRFLQLSKPILINNNQTSN